MIVNIRSAGRVFVAKPSREIGARVGKAISTGSFPSLGKPSTRPIGGPARTSATDGRSVAIASTTSRWPATVRRTASTWTGPTSFTTTSLTSDLLHVVRSPLGRV